MATTPVPSPVPLIIVPSIAARQNDSSTLAPGKIDGGSYLSRSRPTTYKMSTPRFLLSFPFFLLSFLRLEARG